MTDHEQVMLTLAYLHNEVKRTQTIAIWWPVAVVGIVGAMVVVLGVVL